MSSVCIGNVSVGHDPLTKQDLGLLLPKGEHTSLRGVFSLGLHGLGVEVGTPLRANRSTLRKLEKKIKSFRFIAYVYRIGPLIMES